MSAAKEKGWLEVEDCYGYEVAAYLSDEWKVINKLTLLFGLRMNGIFVMGSGTFKTYQADGTVLCYEWLARFKV